MAMDRNTKRLVIGGSVGALALVIGYGIWHRRALLQLGPGGGHEERHGEHGHHKKHKKHGHHENERGEYGEKREKHGHHHHEEHGHGD